MNILFLSSEVVPFIKSGGLADVAGALPKELKKKKEDVRVILPLYSLIDREKFGLTKLFDNACVQMGNCQEFFSVYHTDKPDGLDTYFIEFNKYFDRNGIYDDKHSKEEYKDNAYRYAFFSKAALQVAEDLNFHPDIVHVNDWQTALVPYYIKRHANPFFWGTRTVLTIHNMGYQGVYGADVLPYIGLSLEDFNADTFEDYGRINLLKGGICYADKITTVSPTYAREILNHPGGCGLQNYLNRRAWDLTGFINGIDEDEWDPKTDKRLEFHYDEKTYKKGKALNKQKIQDMFYLERNPSKPLFAIVARLVSQKGLCLLTQCLEQVLQHMHCQFVVVGTGDAKLADYFSSLCTKYLGQFGCYIGYSEDLAHLVEAGSDFFVMPSLYEPCGLNQLYSQIYGTLPLVRGTGGLEDTVQNYNEVKGTGTGFKFYDISSEALYNTIGWANATYYDRPKHINKMIVQAMKQDFSWKHSCELYLGLYQELCKKH
ncbi:MAG: glycogen synthase GlgA [Alphaproteobacteria bacterium]|nr:glycogen synthase GlgA [Alphaproteobacteria bacterium]